MNKKNIVKKIGFSLIIIISVLMLTGCSGDDRYRGVPPEDLPQYEDYIR